MYESLKSYEHVLHTHDIMRSGQMHSTIINLEGSALSKSYSLVTPLESPDKETPCFHQCIYDTANAPNGRWKHLF